MLKKFEAKPAYPTQTRTVFGSIGDLNDVNVDTKNGRNIAPPNIEFESRQITIQNGIIVLRRRQSRNRPKIFGCG